MNKSQLIIITVLVAIATVSRFYLLGTVPHGLSWDEAAVGYNGWSVWTIHRDEWLQILPISFKSFGDFKAPLAIYLNGISTLLLGISPLTIRLPYAIFGLLAFFFFSLLLLLLSKKQWLTNNGAIYGIFVFAIVPWHIHFSRIGFESGIALALILFSSVLILSSHFVTKGWWKLSSKQLQVGLFSLAGIMFAASLYAYHSAKLFVPIFFILLVIVFRRHLHSHRLHLVMFMLFAFIVSLPLGWDTVRGEGATRSNVLLKLSVSQPQVYFQTVGKNILAHIDPAYLIFGKTETFRHGSGSFGIFLPGALFLLLIGLVSPALRIFSRRQFTTAQKYLYLITLSWFVAGMLPGWISVDVPHSNRTLLALPGFVLFAIIGWDFVSGLFSSARAALSAISKALLGIILIVDVLYFSAYLQHYFTTYANISGSDFQEGYEELFSYINQNNVGDTYSTIVISSKYGQPYIFALLFNHINAISYHQGALVKYLFVDSVTEGEFSRSNALIVATSDDALSAKPLHTIFSVSGEPRFFIYESNN